MFSAARYILGPLPEKLCWFLDASTNVILFCFVLVSDFAVLLRFLYASVWKNISALNEDFIMFLAKVKLGVFSILYFGKC